MVRKYLQFLPYHKQIAVWCTFITAPASLNRRLWSAWNLSSICAFVSLTIVGLALRSLKLATKNTVNIVPKNGSTAWWIGNKTFAENISLDSCHFRSRLTSYEPIVSSLGRYGWHPVTFTAMTTLFQCTVIMKIRFAILILKRLFTNSFKIFLKRNLYYVSHISVSRARKMSLKFGNTFLSLVRTSFAAFLTNFCLTKPTSKKLLPCNPFG